MLGPRNLNFEIHAGYVCCRLVETRQAFEVIVCE